jgi:hypothetical protein
MKPREEFPETQLPSSDTYQWNANKMSPPRAQIRTNETPLSAGVLEHKVSKMLVFA